MSKPNLGVVTGTQLLSVVGEVFGQRVSRVHHSHSNLRFLLATVTYSALQATLVLLLLQAILPHSTTDGQGVLSLFPALIAHPSLWLNAVNNTVYWGAQAYLLREPFGVLIIVVGFLVASFVLAPLQAAFGLPIDAPLSWLPTTLGYAGALACVYELSFSSLSTLAQIATQNGIPAFLCLPPSPPSPHPPPPLHTADPPIPTDSSNTFTADQSYDYDRDIVDPTHIASPTPSDPSQPSIQHSMVQEDDDTAGMGVPLLSPTTLPLAASHSPPPGSAPGSRSMPSFLSVGVAWVVLVATTALGIVITTYFEKTIGMNMFGYAAADQILLPVTTIPALLLVNAIPAVRAIFEPEDSPPESFVDLAKRTWAETSLRDMAAFRSTMFAREFLFFFLVTQYPDINLVYLEMTLIRLCLSFLASLVVCKWGSSFIHLSFREAAKTLHPINITTRTLGTCIVTVAIILFNS